jgi:signal transduction histidine kinase
VRGVVRDDGSAVLSVVDDGVGIPAAYREKAFGIFERLAGRDDSSGTGIGLALCRKIVEIAGGSIEIVDAPVGTHVRIVLPPVAVRVASGRPDLQVV